MSEQAKTANTPSTDLNKLEFVPFGVNLKSARHGKSLYILIPDLTANHGKSSSGKTVTIATSSGNQSVGVGDVKVGVNCFSKAMAAQG